jgi:ribosome biogenesis GTPase
MSKKKSGKKRRVAFRANRSSKARDRSWTRQFDAHGFAETDPAHRESVVAKGDLSRKRTVIERAEGESPPGPRRTGRVIAMRGLIAEVHDGERIWPCGVRRVLRTRQIDERHPVAVGDAVEFTPSEEAGREREGVIEEVRPRHGCLTRMYQGRVHTIAANVDVAVIVSALVQPSPKPHLIDRYLVSAHAGDITPVICFNKCDLEAAHDRDAQRLRAVYERLGYRVIVCSAATGIGIEDVRAAIADKVAVFVGQSGVGKSSLINAVVPGLELATGDVSATTEKGRHVTTTARLLPLPFGGFVVDTPGVRSFALGRVSRAELELHFIDIAPLVAECKFPDCTHIHEAGCAVLAAVDVGRIDERRYLSYRKMFEDE